MSPNTRLSLEARGVHGKSSHYQIPCWLDGPGIESWKDDFPHPSRPVLDPPGLLYNDCRVPQLERSGCGVNHPPLPSADVKERVQLYLYSPLGPCGRCTLVFFYQIPLKFVQTNAGNQYTVFNYVRLMATSIKTVLYLFLGYNEVHIQGVHCTKLC